MPNKGSAGALRAKGKMQRKLKDSTKRMDREEVNEKLTDLRSNLTQLKETDVCGAESLLKKSLSVIKCEESDSKIIVDKDLIAGTLVVISDLVKKFGSKIQNMIVEFDVKKLSIDCCEVFDSDDVYESAGAVLRSISNIHKVGEKCLRLVQNTELPEDFETLNCERMVTTVKAATFESCLLTDLGRIVLRLVLKEVDISIKHEYVYGSLDMAHLGYKGNDKNDRSITVYGKQYSVKDLDKVEQNDYFMKMLSSFDVLVRELCGYRIPTNICILLRLTRDIDNWRNHRSLILKHSSIIDRFEFSAKISEAKYIPASSEVYRFMSLSLLKSWILKVELEWKDSDCHSLFEVFKHNCQMYHSQDNALTIFARNCFQNPNRHSPKPCDFNYANKKVYEILNVRFGDYFAYLWEAMLQVEPYKEIVEREF